jgi:type IV secretion system protein VirD4
MQMHSSYVITDPKGTLIVETGKMFKNEGYDIKVLNTINFKKSMHYNPFQYIKSETDILKVVNVLIINTKGEGDKSGEDFWVKSERLLYTSLIAYLYYEAPIHERTIPMLIEFIEECEVREDDEDFKNAIDILFEELEEKDSRNFAVKQYKKFKLAAGKTTKSILISCAARLAPFDIPDVCDLMAYDELELDEVGDRKTAFFVVMSDTDTTFSFIIAMMFYQMFNLLCDKADDVYGGRLPFHVRCMLDEFANIGKIPRFENLISTIRSREISASILVQSLAQIKSIYKDDAETIIDCCDTLVFLGGKSNKTNKDFRNDR